MDLVCIAIYWIEYDSTTKKIKLPKSNIKDTRNETCFIIHEHLASLNDKGKTKMAVKFYEEFVKKLDSQLK